MADAISAGETGVKAMDVANLMEKREGDMHYLQGKKSHPGK